MKKERIDKKIDVRNGRIRYLESRGILTESYSIDYYIVNKEEKLEKIITFNMWDDFSFKGYMMNDLDENNSLEFEIEKDNIIYNSINKFLGKETQICIEDDESKNNQKIMIVKRDNNNIKITFYNNKSKEEQDKDMPSEKYYVFIKNIAFDGRSRLDYIPYKELNIKERLWNLFYDMRTTIAPKEILEKEVLDKLPGDGRIIFRIIPELKACEGFDHKHPHHCYDVWNHTKEAIRKSKPDLQIRLALLLHDIGKPHSCQEDGEARHFHGHPQKSAEMSQEILTRLGYSEKEVKEICYLVENHDNIINVEKVNKNNIELTKKLLHIQYCDAYAHAPQHIEKRIKKLDEIKKKLEERIITIQETKEER